MADIAVPGHHHRYSKSIGSVNPTSAMAVAAADYEMVRNPDFAFPRLPQPLPLSTLPDLPRDPSTRPASTYADVPRSRASGEAGKHRRAVSTLPSFSFNSTDASGLQPEQTPSPPSTPPDARAEEATTNTAAFTPSRHTRNNSEFVGGDSRFGMGKAIHNSPSKLATSSVPAGRRSHRRGQSVALSQHDLGSIMAPPESPRLSSSLPNSPLELPSKTTDDDGGFNEQSFDEVPVVVSRVQSADRPTSSRREVAFSPNVEIIPRPLSTISSETESSISTVRGHSVNNSISSMLSMGMPSPASARVRSPSLEVTHEDEPSPTTRSSAEISKHFEREGQWLRSGRSFDDEPRPFSEPTAPAPRQLTFTPTEPSMKSRNTHKRKQSSNHALGFDRRKSEPLIGMHMSEPSRFSAISLQDPTLLAHATDRHTDVLSSDSRSSGRKLKDWAMSKLSRKQKEHCVPQTTVVSSPLPAPEPEMMHTSPTATQAEPSPVAETDLDAVFGNQTTSSQIVEAVRPHSMFELNTPILSQHSTTSSDDSDEHGSLLDLDTALGPFNTPPLGPQRHRREMHSNRLTRDFAGPGGHYLPAPSHRRAESAPMLTPFDFGRTSTPPQPIMADVFEEEEEDDVPRAPGSSGTQSTRDEESGIGIQVVDADASTHVDSGRSALWHGEDDWVMERPRTSYGNQSSRLSTPIIERRPSSILAETIEEEPTHMESLEIVGDDEEPRAPSFAKSSDSSDTPTLLAPRTGLPTLSDGSRSFTTLDNLQSSAFSSPDFGRRQGSFDTSRVGTSASSATDARTLSSYNGADMALDHRVSVDDVPSLTSSRSTMMTHGNVSKRDFSDMRTPSAHSNTIDRTVSAEQRRKRLSIQSLSNFVGGPFGSKTNLSQSRPQTASNVADQAPKKKDHRLKKLMFWKSKQRQANSQT